MATEAEVRAAINFKKINGTWGINISRKDFSSCGIDIKITRQDSFGHCRDIVYKNIKFDQDSSGRWGIANYKADQLRPLSAHDNVIDLRGKVINDNPNDYGKALVNYAINSGAVSMSTNFNSGQFPDGEEQDDIKLNNSTTFHRFSTLEGETKQGGTLNYQSNPTQDGRKAPSPESNNDGSSFPKTLRFYDQDGNDVNAKLILDSPSIAIKNTPSATRVTIATKNGNLKGKDISNNGEVYISRTLDPNKKKFYTIIHEGNNVNPKKISTNRSGGAFYENKDALEIEDSCTGDDKKNTIIEIDCIHTIKLTGPAEDEDPIEPTPDPTTPPTVTVVETGGPCPTNPPWSNGWPGSYKPDCTPGPTSDNSEESIGGLILTKNPGNKKNVSLTFGDLVGASNRLRQELGLFDFAESRSLKNKLITIKIDWSRAADWAQNFQITASCSDIKQGSSLNPDGGAPYSRPTRSYPTGFNSDGTQTFYVYNIDGSSTVNFNFSSTPVAAPTRTRYTGQTTTTTESTSGDPPVTTVTHTTTCIPPGGITESYSPWPPCPEEAFVTKSGGERAKAVYSDGAPDGANDQFITVTLVAIRESVVEGPSNPSIGIGEELIKKIWLTSGSAASANNFNGVNGLSLADYHEHDALVRFRNPATSTSLTSLPTGGTGISEFIGHSGAKLPGNIDTAISNASSLPVNLSQP